MILMKYGIYTVLAVGLFGALALAFQVWMGGGDEMD
jgi:nitrate reductase NapE component